MTLMYIDVYQGICHITGVHCCIYHQQGCKTKYITLQSFVGDSWTQMQPFMMLSRLLMFPHSSPIIFSDDGKTIEEICLAQQTANQSQSKYQDSMKGNSNSGVKRKSRNRSGFRSKKKRLSKPMLYIGRS